MGASGYVGVAGNLAAELYGLLHGLLRAHELGLQTATLYSDSQKAIRIVNGIVDEDHCYYDYQAHSGLLAVG